MSILRKLLLQLAALCFLTVSLSMPAQAAVLGTGEYLALEQRQANLDTVAAAFAREDVRQQLIDMGVDPDQALARVADLPEHELARVAGELEELPAGGNLLALIGAVFVVLLILELTGVINIFNNV
ncbi:MAG: PA2779 family protein [Pseudomonadota bacterium]